MNELIYKLAREADKLARIEIPDLREIVLYDRIRDEKFAELIVKECISRIEGCAVETSPDDFVKGYNKGVSKVSSQVKQYFGVEE